MSEETTRQRRKLAAILMADVAGFSRLMGADEESTTGRIQDFFRRVGQLVEQHQGRVVDTAGDSVFGEFDSVVNAMRCAAEIQRDQARANEARADEEPIETRIGVHLGDVIVEDYRVFGDGVNIAARLEALADPGGICLSEAVYQQVHNKLGLEFEEVGMRELKNIEHPLRLYRVAPRALPAVAERRPLPAPSPPTVPRSFASELRRPLVLVPVVVGVCLLASPLYLFSTGGLFPTVGAILVGTMLGAAGRRVTGRRGPLMWGIGLGVAAGAPLTNWSPVTNGLFVVAGVILAALGLSSEGGGQESPRGQ